MEDVSGWKLELRQTCKVVANEMKGASLRTNFIAFTSALSEGEGGDYRALLQGLEYSSNCCFTYNTSRL
jgi:hypothetical protein